METPKISENTAHAGYDFTTPFLLDVAGTRLVEIQPTLQCNLRCAHCYSESGPSRRDELSLNPLVGFLESAADLGYSYVGVSGGEPLLWSHLEDFLDFARLAGFSTSITTNATLLTPERAMALHGRTDLVAVSVDGPPADHAAIRGSDWAFPAMQKGLAALRDEGIPFTLAFTLTRFNADRLAWLYEFAHAEGAAGINVHPLCDFGAATVNLSGATPDSREFQAASWLLALLAEEQETGTPAITLDAIRRVVIEQSRWPLLANNNSQLHQASFSDLVPSLIVEPDGCVVPFIYGFPRKWALGFLEQDPLTTAVESWRNTCVEPIAELIHSTLQRLAACKAEYIDLFGEILASAQRCR
ncbi:MAG: radical SAM protein [bacterium]|nr:radical SAM protein [bacterium]